MSDKRKVTLFYRAESASKTVGPTITTDRRHAERSGTITRIYRSKKQTLPTLMVCVVPKGTAPWEISSELSPLMCAEKPFSMQLTQMGLLGDLLLAYFEGGNGWDEEIVIVPEKMVPKREKACEADDA